MKVLPSKRDHRRRERRLLRRFFAAMGCLAVLFALLFLGRLALESLPWE
jgi:hypothetical protein